MSGCSSNGKETSIVIAEVRKEESWSKKGVCVCVGDGVQMVWGLALGFYDKMKNHCFFFTWPNR